jgi:hypothetical protein
MEKYKFILLVDFSDNSRDMLQHAYNWGKSCDASFIAIHQAIPLTPAFTDAEMQQHLIQSEINTQSEKLKLFIQDNLPKEALVRMKVDFKPLSQQIKEVIAANTKHIPIVFTGLKGTGFLKKIFIGSQVLNVINNIDATVVGIPPAMPNFTIHKLFIGIHPDYPINTVALCELLNSFSNEKLKLIFFHISSTDENHNEIARITEVVMQSIRVSYPYEIKFLQSKSEFNELRAQITENDDQILILQKGSRLITDQLFRKYLINELVYEGKTPLVVLS